MLTWKTFRDPHEEEKEWYKVVWGSRRANAFFTTYYNNLKTLKKSGKQQYNTARKAVEIHIKNYDEFIPIRFKRICEEYQDIVEKYPYPSAMLLELVYPQFLRELHDTISTSR